jgi:murein L,D-transpeptidase YafK
MKLDMNKILLIISIAGLVLSGKLLSDPFLKPLDKSLPVDCIIIKKSKRTLELYSTGNLLKSYKISLGKNPIGAKRFLGDNKTPEGNYFIKGKYQKSRFHKSLWISYPEQKDIEYAAKNSRDPGGEILIHGLTNGFSLLGRAHLLSDWTRGCIAVTNKEIDELYDAIKQGTAVEIRP